MSDVLTVPTGTDVTELSAVLDSVEAFMGRFIHWPDEHCGALVTLWAAHTHAAVEFERTGRLLVTADTFGAGKTRVLDVLSKLVSGGRQYATITAASLFRLVHKCHTSGEAPPTFLLDEVDRWIDKDIISLLNVGYRSGAKVPRADPNSAFEVIEMSVYAPVVVCGLVMGRMPQDFRSRCIKISMEPKPAGVRVENFTRHEEPHARALRDELASAMRADANVWEWHEPSLPEGVSDRRAEIWSPLLAVADLAGGKWPARAWAACVAYTAAANDRADMEFEDRLLLDVRDVYQDLIEAWRGGALISDLTGLGVRPLVDDEHVAGDVLHAALKERDDMPWVDQPWFTRRKMCDMLRPFNIVSRPHRYRQGVHEVTARGTQRRGYSWAEFVPHWDKFPDGM